MASVNLFEADGAFPDVPDLIDTECCSAEDGGWSTRQGDVYARNVMYPGSVWKIATERRKRLLALCLAKRALPIYSARYPDDKYPALALDTAERFTEGRASSQDLWDIDRYHRATPAAVIAYRREMLGAQDHRDANRSGHGYDWVEGADRSLGLNEHPELRLALEAVNAITHTTASSAETAVCCVAAAVVKSRARWQHLMTPSVVENSEKADQDRLFKLFLPVPEFDPQWVTPETAQLAGRLYQEEAVGPYLADALAEAGYDGYWLPLLQSGWHPPRGATMIDRLRGAE